MSDTDDTDELLLIPPDLFTIPEPETPFYGVVDTLITQVNSLEERVSYLQNTSDLTLVSSSLDSPESSAMFTNNFRKFNSAEDLPLSHRMHDSPHSSPQKPRNKYTLNSLPASPNDRFIYRKNRSPLTTLPKTPNIDSFISTVNAIKKLGAARNLSREFDNGSEKGEVEKDFIKENAWKCGENIGTVPDYGLGVRKLMHNQNFGASTLESKSSSSSSSDATQTTVFNKLDDPVTSNALNVLNRHKKSLEKENSHGQSNLPLLSLSKLWRNNEKFELPSKYREKLEEERLRRQHCEQQILELQNKMLELQEKVAVALKVDEAKDIAIVQFQEAWEKIAPKFQHLSDDKNRLEQEIENIREKCNRELANAQQKIHQFEKEAFDTSSTVQKYREKITVLEQRVLELDNDLKLVEVNLDDVKTKYLKEVEKNRAYPEIIAQKEVELNEGRNFLYEARREVQLSKQAVEICQADLSSLKDENAKLEHQLSKEKETVCELKEQKTKLLNELDDHKKIGKRLEEELKKLQDHLENNKVELKNFYQGQVELVVQTKLKEFQNQLEQVETTLKEDLKKRETAIAKKAALHIQQIFEKNDIEIKLLEERHREEINFYQMKLNKQHEEIEDLKQKMSREREKSGHFYKQVMKFVESVRQEENSLSNEKFRTPSYTNLEEIMLSMNEDEDKDNTKKTKETKEKKEYKVPDETPLTSRSHRRHKDGELRSLIDVLLDKPPGQPLGEKDEKYTWQPAPGNEGTGPSRHKEKKANDKRPWK